MSLCVPQSDNQCTTLWIEEISRKVEAARPFSHILTFPLPSSLRFPKLWSRECIRPDLRKLVGRHGMDLYISLSKYKSGPKFWNNLASIRHWNNKTKKNQMVNLNNMHKFGFQFLPCRAALRDQCSIRLEQSSKRRFAPPFADQNRMKWPFW